MTLSFLFHHGVFTTHNIVLEGAHAVWLALKADYIVQCPSTASQWKKVSDGFQEKWNLPHCLGAIDGKHVLIQAPANTGSSLYNYKGTFSSNLMVVSDTQCRFLSVDVGEAGRHSDGGVFSSSEFGHALLNNKLPLLQPEDLPSISQFPFYFVGDKVFPLKTNLLRPYPGRNLTEKKSSTLDCPAGDKSLRTPSAFL